MKDGHLTTLKLKEWGWLILLLFVAIFAVQSPLQASASKTSYQVEYINDRLTIHVNNVALGPVLAKIKEKTGVEFVVGQEQSGKLISCQLESLPLVEGLKRMLRQFNHALLFGPDNKPTKVVILGYANLDSFPRPSEGTETPSVQRVISPSSAETKDIKPDTKEGRGVTSSSEIRHINQPAVEDMISTHSLETMATKPALVSVVDMIVPTPTEVIAFRVENMIIRGFTGESK
jgi:hypothetical protein